MSTSQTSSGPLLFCMHARWDMPTWPFFCCPKPGSTSPAALTRVLSLPSAVPLALGTKFSWGCCLQVIALTPTSATRPGFRPCSLLPCLGTFPAYRESLPVGEVSIPEADLKVPIPRPSPWRRQRGQKQPGKLKRASNVRSGIQKKLRT